MTRRDFYSSPINAVVVSSLAERCVRKNFTDYFPDRLSQLRFAQAARDIEYVVTPRHSTEQAHPRVERQGEHRRDANPCAEESTIPNHNSQRSALVRLIFVDGFDVGEVLIAFSWFA